MKKCLKYLVIISCLVASTHNGDASSYFGGRWAMPKVAAMTVVPVAGYFVWNQNTSPVVMQPSQKPAVSANSFFTMNGTWSKDIPLFSTPAVISTPPEITKKDCGCGACPNTIANKPLSREESQTGLQELLKFSPKFPNNEACFLSDSSMTPKQWCQLVHEVFATQIVPPWELSDHHKKCDQLLRRMLSARDYNALVEAKIHQPLSPRTLNTLDVIAKH